MLDKNILKQKISETEEIVYSFLPEKDPMTDRIVSAVCYSVKAGGKRLRPLMMRESYIMFADGREETAILHAFMAAIEFIHTYSLVHDDLPAMDNDVLRRGKPSTFAAYGEAFGVLAGDALLNEAFEIIAAEMENINDAGELKKAVKALHVLAKKAGINGMVGGQSLDVYSEKTEDHENTLEELEFIYMNKTSALLEASLMTGAILAGASDENVAAMEMIAGKVGMAFQIRDDILDMTASTEQMGKPAGSDEKNNKKTVASIKGIEAAQADVEKYSEESIQLMDGLEHKNVFLRDLITDLAARSK